MSISSVFLIEAGLSGLNGAMDTRFDTRFFRWWLPRQGPWGRGRFVFTSCVPDRASEGKFSPVGAPRDRLTMEQARAWGCGFCVLGLGSDRDS